MKNVTIVSDGTALGTKVQIGEEFLTGITRIEIEPIESGGFVRARFVIDIAALDIQIKDAHIECTDDAAAEQIRKALLRVDEVGNAFSDELSM